MSQAIPETGRPAKGTLNALVFQYRGILAGLPLVYAFFSTQWEWENHLATWIFAGLLAAGGAGIRGWARCHCGYGHRAGKSLATTGPYALARNPLYVGNLMLIAAGVVASELWWFVPVALGWSFLVYSITIRHEESRMIQKYGQPFLEYREKVPAWLPRLARTDRPRQPMSLKDFLRATGPQLVNSVLILSPFILKELNPFHLWHQ